MQVSGCTFDQIQMSQQFQIFDGVPDTLLDDDDDGPVVVDEVEEVVPLEDFHTTQGLDQEHHVATNHVATSCRSGTVEFTLGKGLLSCYRDETPTDVAEQDASCYCLPPFFYKGCVHDSPPPFTTRLKLDDCMCTSCSKCTRCGRFLGKRCPCHALHSLYDVLLDWCVAGQAPKGL